MEVVGAGLGDGVDLTAGGLAELDGVVGSLSLELLDGVERVDVRSARGAAAGLREQHLVVIGAVDVVLVVETADAVEADESGAAVGGDVGCVEDEGAPITGGDGKIGDEGLIDGLGDFGLLGVDERRLAGDDDLSGDGGGRKGDVDGEDLAYGEDEVLAVDFAEAAAAGADLIVSGKQEGGSEGAITVGGEGAGDSGVGIEHDDSRVGNGGSALVSERAVDVAVTGRLGRRQRRRRRERLQLTRTDAGSGKLHRVLPPRKTPMAKTVSERDAYRLEFGLTYLPKTFESDLNLNCCK